VAFDELHLSFELDPFATVLGDALMLNSVLRLHGEGGGLSRGASCAAAGYRIRRVVVSPPVDASTQRFSCRTSRRM